MAQLEWKGIEGFPNYRISNTGIVQSCRKGKGYTDWYDLRLRDNHPSGYVYVGLYSIPRTRKWFRLNRLMYQTFIDCIPDTHVVDHKDNDKQNNNLNNLQLLTWAENTQKYYKHKKKNNGQKGKKVCTNSNS